MKPKWDTELGFEMYLNGKTDEEIAQALGTTAGAVGWQRRNSWKKITPGTVEKSEGTAAVNFGDCKPGKKGRGAKSHTTPRNDTGEKKGIVAAEEPLRNDTRGGAETDTDVRYKDRGSVMKLIEGAVENKTGMDAVLTADAVLCLWSWDSIEHLQAAKRSIELLIEKLGGSQ